MANTSRPFRLRIRGDLACFSRPELRVERVSYLCLTPSAARGIFDSILYKPAIYWEIVEIALLRAPQLLQFRRNEVNSRASDRSANACRNSGEPWNYYADEDRAQRNTIALKDVDYAVTGRMVTTSRLGPGENIQKFEEMFLRRLRKGQWVTPPVLGCREFPAQVEEYLGDPAPISHSEDLGMMLHDIRFGRENEPVFFHARVEAGRITVPPFPRGGGGAV